MDEVGGSDPGLKERIEKFVNYPVNIDDLLPALGNKPPYVTFPIDPEELELGEKGPDVKVVSTGMNPDQSKNIEAPFTRTLEIPPANPESVIKEFPLDAPSGLTQEDHEEAIARHERMTNGDALAMADDPVTPQKVVESVASHPIMQDAMKTLEEGFKKKIDDNLSSPDDKSPLPEEDNPLPAQAEGQWEDYVEEKMENAYASDDPEVIKETWAELHELDEKRREDDTDDRQTSDN